MDRHDFARRLAEAARQLSDATAPDDALQRIVEVAVDLIPTCEIAGVCVLSRSKTDVCAHSDDAVQVMDDLQRELGEGPLLDDLTTADMVTIDDLAGDVPWPQWGREVVEQTGMRSYLGLRLFTDGRSTGALNLYSSQPRAFTEQDQLDGLVLAAHAAVALSATVRHDQLHTALASRQLIGEATGILRARFSLTSEQAFGVLKRLSSHENMKLFAVAQHVVEGGELPLPGTLRGAGMGTEAQTAS